MKYQEGTVVLDMHYGLSRNNIPNDLELVSSIQVRKANASEFVADMVKEATGEQNVCISNKMLVVVDAWGQNIKCAYSYDGRYFGLVYFKLRTPR